MERAQFKTGVQQGCYFYHQKRYVHKMEMRAKKSTKEETSG